MNLSSLFDWQCSYLAQNLTTLDSKGQLRSDRLSIWLKAYSMNLSSLFDWQCSYLAQNLTIQS